MFSFTLWRKFLNLLQVKFRILNRIKTLQPYDFPSSQIGIKNRTSLPGRSRASAIRALATRKGKTAKVLSPSRDSKAKIEWYRLIRCSWRHQTEKQRTLGTIRILSYPIGAAIFILLKILVFKIGPASRNLGVLSPSGYRNLPMSWGKILPF